MSMKQCVLRSAVLAALAAPGLVFSGSASASDVDAPLSLKPSVQAPAAEPKQATVDERPVMLDAAPAESPQIHGFIDVPFTTAYITPRGLCVENQGLVIQPVGGIVFLLGDLGPLKGASAVVGVWNSINLHQNDARVGAWNEMDFFASFGASITKELKMDATYGAWNFPNSTLGKPRTEHNIDVKFSYDDTALWGTSGFALHPYVDIFWGVYGDSTVSLGKNGGTFYVEPGIVPTYTFKASPDYPITLTFPTYISVGPESYWGRGGTGFGGTVSAEPDGNLGVFSTAVNASIPLGFIPARFGHWHAEAGVQYYYIINDALKRAGEALSGNTQRSLFRGTIGIGVNF